MPVKCVFFLHCAIPPWLDTRFLQQIPMFNPGWESVIRGGQNGIGASLSLCASVSYCHHHSTIIPGFIHNSHITSCGEGSFCSFVCQLLHSLLQNLLKSGTVDKRIKYQIILLLTGTASSASVYQLEFDPSMSVIYVLQGMLPLWPATHQASESRHNEEMEGYIRLQNL